MKNLLFAFIFLFAFVSCKTAKQHQESDTARIERQSGHVPWSNSLGWEISGNGLEEVSYLFGTMHMIPRSSYFLPQSVSEAFDKSDKVVFEIDMNELSDMGAMMGLIMDAFMKDGKTLRDLLTEQEYQRVAEHFERMGLPMMMFERIKPMFLSMFATQDFAPRSLQANDMVSYEAEFFQRAAMVNKAIGGLESLEYQMSIFDSIPYDVQADMLLESIAGKGAETNLLDTLIEVYTRQDIESLVELMHEEGSGMKGYEGLLLYDRNKNWIPIMEEEMRRQKTFFAVGAGHLGGPQGILHLLKKKGYRLKALE